eukprot:scaffold14.g1062.t1
MCWASSDSASLACETQKRACNCAVARPPARAPRPLLSNALRLLAIPCCARQGYREDDGLYLESDTDEQLLIHIPFNTACKLSGLVIKSSGSSSGQAPKKVKLFVNWPTIGFSEAADTAGVQEFELGEKELAGELLQLNAGDTFNVADIKDVSKEQDK